MANARGCSPRSAEDDARLALNQTLREVNSLLAADCGIEPLAIYSAG